MTTYEPCTIVVPVLGEQWVLQIVSKEKEPRFERLNCDGFCDWTTRQMIVRSFNKDDDFSVRDPRASMLHSIKHELVHAFMFASGLAADWEHKSEFGQEETVVDWIAWQMEKMAKTMEFIKGELKEKEIETA